MDLTWNFYIFIMISYFIHFKENMAWFVKVTVGKVYYHDYLCVSICQVHFAIIAVNLIFQEFIY